MLSGRFSEAKSIPDGERLFNFYYNYEAVICSMSSMFSSLLSSNICIAFRYESYYYLLISFSTAELVVTVSVPNIVNNTCYGNCNCYAVTSKSELIESEIHSLFFAVNIV